MSHGDHETHRSAFNLIREVSTKLETPVAVLADLCGPKIRTGRFIDDGIELVTGSEVILTIAPVLGKPGLIPSQYAALVDDVVIGDSVLLADGLMELEVIRKGDGEAVCRVIQGGFLGNNKGINLPGVAVSAPSLTAKDQQDAQFALALGVDFIALSFVRSASDIDDLKKLISESGHAETSTDIIAKIEKPEALTNAEEIIESADAIMVARGDLGVELPPEQVPLAQTQLIRMACGAGKPVIVATQMLESMISNARPTRAEVTDVSHAVEAGVDALMLSAETAAGHHPVAAVEMMDRIARQTEAELWRSNEYGLVATQKDPPIPLWHVIAETTARMSRDLMARAVIVVTRSGKSAEIVSTARPASPIIAVSADPAVVRKLCLRWGVVPLIDVSQEETSSSDLAKELAVSLGLAVAEQYVLLVRGFHGDQNLNLPSVTVVQLH